MIRTILWILTLALCCIVSLPLEIYMAVTGKNESYKHTQWILDFSLPKLNAVAGFHPEVYGRENMPEGPALYVGNHQGMFDLIIILCCLGKFKPIVSKKEIGSIPILGTLMRESDCILLDRGNPRQSLKAMQQAEELLKSGKSVIIFPEGTRSRCDQMREFKAGALRCAVKAEVPIVPFAIDGAWHAKEETGNITPCTCRVTILPPVETKDLERSKTKTIAADVQNLIMDQLVKDHPDREEVLRTMLPDKEEEAENK